MPMTCNWRDAGLVAAGALGGASLLLLCSQLRTAAARRSVELEPLEVRQAEERKAWLQQQLANHLKGTTAMAMVYLGDQLKLYKTMSSRNGWTASRLAKAAGGLKVRLVQEWLAQQAACGILDFEVETQSFSLPKAAAALLAEDLSGSFFAPYATMMLACWKRMPTMIQAFRGQCLAPTYDEAGEDLADAMARLHVPEARFHFIPKVLPLVQGGSLLKRLTNEQILCADVGASGADVTIEMATQFPTATFHAYEVANPALHRARANVKQKGLRNLQVVDAKVDPLGSSKTKYDFIMCYDVLHDLSDPEQLMREVREVLAPDGVWVIVDITSEGDMTNNIESHPKAATYYGISVCVCLPSGLSADGGRGLGTLGFPPDLAEPMFHNSGFSRVRSFKMPGLEKNQVYEVQI
ncbi:Uncharacterized S-adenosylmethionine-dependent methyltransferase Rv2258c [Durusdinium trenchii]|uniref:Uncharacterized S-adenosylmethionine-dependent methyltransferase Rv2258c n=1 Tax=Durusdinium trenchii TaxID=1381693 RepID=A0ABP0J632_9DINO